MEPRTQIYNAEYGFGEIVDTINSMHFTAFDKETGASFPFHVPLLYPVYRVWFAKRDPPETTLWRYQFILVSEMGEKSIAEKEERWANRCPAPHNPPPAAAPRQPPKTPQPAKEEPQPQRA